MNLGRQRRPRLALPVLTLALGAALAPSLRAAPALTVLHAFGPAGATGSAADGSTPRSTLVAPGDGFLYGTTSEAGPGPYLGTAFKVRPDGTGYALIQGFPALDGSGDNTRGAHPFAGLIAPGDGYLYGTASAGGAGGQGTVFRLHGDGSGFTVLHAFSALSGGTSGTNADGAQPHAALLAPGDGYVYGTAEVGGARGDGTVFRVATDGATFEDLHDFTGTGGANPLAALTDGGDGYFYGTTSGGGQYGEGSLFRLNADGTGLAILYSFTAVDSSRDNADGVGPRTPLVALGDGYVYGSAVLGGVNGQGTVFRVSVDGSHFQTLHSFTAPPSGSQINADGGIPYGGLTAGGDGSLYGVGAAFGPNGSGVVFHLAPDGSRFEVVHAFSALSAGTTGPTNGDNPDGSFPQAAVLRLGDGSLYGAASFGGPNGTGTVFRLAPPASTTHLLWDNTDGRAMLWDVNPDGSFSVLAGYGPYTDGSDPNALWTATALATGPDGVSHILWNNSDHRVMLWNVKSDGSFTVIGGYGPYTDGSNANALWSAVGLSVGPDNVMHLLWDNTDHRAMFWNVNQDGSFQVKAGYGPYTDNSPQNVWDAAGVSTGPDNVSHLLWSNSDHRAMFWDVSSADGSFSVKGGYGPYTDGSASNLWGAIGVSTGPDNVSHLLWNNSDLRAMFWDVSGSDGSFSVLAGYGPYTDNAPGNTWSVTGLATGADNVSHLLWNNVDHRAMLWDVSNADGSFTVRAGYGPYTDGAASNLWSAVGVSAGP